MSVIVSGHRCDSRIVKWTVCAARVILPLLQFAQISFKFVRIHVKCKQFLKHFIIQIANEVWIDTCGQDIPKSFFAVGGQELFLDLFDGLWLFFYKFYVLLLSLDRFDPLLLVCLCFLLDAELINDGIHGGLILQWDLDVLFIFW